MLSERLLPAERWCEVAGLVEFSINNTVSASTGFAPSQLVFGHHLRSVIDVLLPDVSAPGTNITLPAVEERARGMQATIVAA